MSDDRRRVLVAGGGVGGLEAILALQALAADRVRIELVTAEPRFVYRPLLVGEPFGATGHAELDLAGFAEDRGVELRLGRVLEVDADRRAVRTPDSERTYDSLVLALGARPLPIVRGAVNFRDVADVAALQAALGAASTGARVTFVASAGSSWTLPIYELALLTAAWSRARTAGLRLSVVTFERAPLEVFGPNVSGRVGELLEAQGIALLTGTVPESVGHGRLFVPMAGSLPADLVVALPGLAGIAVAGVPANPVGFVEVDDHSRVRGLEDAFAVGDMTAASTRQGGLAAQQADAVAATIAAAAGADAAPAPVPAALRAVLLTGDGPRYLSRPAAGDGEEWATDPPWWPPHKIVSRHLGPYLASHPELQGA